MLVLVPAHITILIKIIVIIIAIFISKKILNGKIGLRPPFLALQKVVGYHSGIKDSIPKYSVIIVYNGETDVETS